MSCDQDQIITAGDCDPCGPAVRNRWFKGKTVLAADYEIEQRYHIGRRRLTNQTLHGAGIVHGMDVVLRGQRIEVTSGLALDRCGREIILCDPLCTEKPDQLLVLRQGHCGLESAGRKGRRPHKEPDESCGDEGVQSYLLAIHYAEHGINGVRIGSDCGDEQCVPNHVCETAILSLQPLDADHPHLLQLSCDTLDLPKDAKAKGNDYHPWLTDPFDDRGAKDLCLCACKTGDAACCTYCRPPALVKWGGYQLDFDAGVALAIVTLGVDECGKPTFDQLIPIIRQCALTRIQDLGWANWHERPGLVISRRNFSSMFIAPPALTRAERSLEDDDYEEDEEDRSRRPSPEKFPDVATRFWVCFSAPVQVASLTRDVISMTLVQPDSREAVGNVVRVPITGVYCRPTTPGDPEGTTRGFTFFVHYQFWQGEIQRGARSGFRSETEVEIRIDGSSIIDWAGRPIDGDSIGRRVPSGNGTPGGTFLSSWRVMRNSSTLPPRGEPIGKAEAATSPSKALARPSVRETEN